MWQLVSRSSQAVEGPGTGERQAEAPCGRPLAGQEYLQGDGVGKPLSPARRREALRNVVTVLHVSERPACLTERWRIH